MADFAECFDTDHSEAAAAEVAHKLVLDHKHHCSGSVGELPHSVKDLQDPDQLAALVLFAAEAGLGYRMAGGSGWQATPASLTLRYWVFVVSSAKCYTERDLADDIAGSEVVGLGIGAKVVGHSAAVPEVAGIAAVELVVERFAEDRGTVLAFEQPYAPFVELE